MTRNVTVLAAAFLMGCSGSKDTGSGETGTGTNTQPHCANSVTARFPVSGDSDVYYKTPIRYTLETEEDGATIDVADSAGAAVNGTTTVDGTVVSWTGDAFESSSAYTATLHYNVDGCADDVISFTTSATGGEVSDPTTLVGNVYALDLANGQWVKPPGVGPLLATQLGDTQILVTPQSVDATSITMFGGIGSADTQDLCSPTIPFPPADFENPFFSLDADLLPLVVAGVEIDIANLNLSGAFAPDGSRIQGASLAGGIDTRPLGPAFGLGTAEDSVCQLVSTFGVACEDCADGSGAFCLSVYLDNVNADKVDGTLVPVTQADIDANPDCATGT